MFLLVLTSILGSAETIRPKLVQYVLRTVGREGPAERQIRQEIAALKQESQGISMVDEFATYARVQRKINALNQQHKAKVQERSIGELRVRLVLEGLLRAMTTLVSIWLVWEHHRDPVVSLSPGLVWPLGPLLAFPGCQLGEISVMVWLGIVHSVCNRITGSLTGTRPVSQLATPPPVVPQSATLVAPPLD